MILKVNINPVPDDSGVLLEQFTNEVRKTRKEEFLKDPPFAFPQFAFPPYKVQVNKELNERGEHSVAVCRHMIEAGD